MKLLNRKLTIWVVVASVVGPMVAAGCGSSKEDEAPPLKAGESKAATHAPKAGKSSAGVAGVRGEKGDD